MAGPVNSSAAAGTLQQPQPPSVKTPLKCGDCGSYKELNKKAAAPDHERDHIPAKATLREAAYQRAGGEENLSTDVAKCIKNGVEDEGITVAIPKAAHRNYSPTCGSKNTKLQIRDDAKSPESLSKAVDRDLAAMTAHLKNSDCEEAYAEAAEKVKNHDNEKMMESVIKRCKSKFE